MGHDDCGGAGMAVSEPACPWWQGLNPRALKLDPIH